MDKRAVSTLGLYGIKGKLLQEIVNCWNQPHRHYHTMEHLNHLVGLVYDDPQWQQHDDQLLVLAAVYHDVVYDIARNDNEEQSASFFDISVSSKYIQDSDRQLVKAMIMATSAHTEYYGTHIVREFVRYDLYPLLKFSKADMVRYEQQVFKEYQRYSVKEYVTGRVGVLSKFYDWADKEEHNAHTLANIQWLIDYVKYRTYHVGVYAGSFAPLERHWARKPRSLGRARMRRAELAASWRKGSGPFTRNLTGAPSKGE